ncbi:MAG: hypothetical protein OHK0039_49350 [Bacteroidia bacterium]
MTDAVRQQYNAAFIPARYAAFLEHIYAIHGHQTPFRISETPVFIPHDLRQRLEQACADINAVICQPDFKARTAAAIPPGLAVPGEDAHTLFLQMDFGICHDAQGDLVPQLIELQGFPSLYFFQDLLAASYRQHFDLPPGYPSHLNGLSSAQYIDLLREAIVGDADPETVVMLEIEPEKQNTYIDFLETRRHLGIAIRCISAVRQRGRRLYYTDDAGREVPIARVYNRVIFDELARRPNLPRGFDFGDDLDVTWVGHPNWFFRISKYTLPMLSGPYVPPSYFLDQLATYPDDLENYVLKPLFSFSGQGVNIHVRAADLDAIPAPERSGYLLQRKVAYAPAIATPSGPAKCEIRMMMVWLPGQPAPRIVNNLIRLSKGDMVGVRYNKDKDWVGASVGFYAR